ncbi:MAG: Na-K-Cl cotransporter, partial [Bradymonadaceae bacterium]
ALWVTGAMILLSLLLRNLNAVAPLITMFFLVTYAMLNIAVLIEQSLGMISFRPLFRISRWISGLGLIGSTFAMFILSPTVSLISVGIVLAVYVYLSKDESRIDASVEDVRSGLFFSLASWAANRTNELTSGQERAWRPNLLVPIEDASTLRGDYALVEGITRPQGAVELLGHTTDPGDRSFAEDLNELTDTLRERDNFATSAIVSSVGYREAVLTRLETLAGQYFFRPNILFLHMPETVAREQTYREFIGLADDLDMGTIVYLPHPTARLGQQSSINVWIPDRSPHWQVSWDVGNLDLCLLTGYKLKTNWEGTLRLITVVEQEDQVEPARQFLDEVSYRARLQDTEHHVAAGQFRDYLSAAPHADVNIFGLIKETGFGFMREACAATDSSCLAVRGSGHENVFA